MAYGYLTLATWQRNQAARRQGTGSLLFDLERKRKGGVREAAEKRAPMPPVEGDEGKSLQGTA